MNYRKIYEQIIERRKNEKPEGYVERHHIVPKSLGGDDNKENVVALTAREHFICHYLLMKMYEEKTNPYYKMVVAFGLMARQNNDQLRYINSRLYEFYRKNASIAISCIQSYKGERRAKELYERFKSSGCRSLNEFVKKGFVTCTQPALTMLFRKYIEEYRENSQQRKSYLANL